MRMMDNQTVLSKRDDQSVNRKFILYCIRIANLSKGTNPTILLNTYHCFKRAKIIMSHE